MWAGAEARSPVWVTEAKGTDRQRDRILSSPTQEGGTLFHSLLTSCHEEGPWLSRASVNCQEEGHQRLALKLGPGAGALRQSSLEAKHIPMLLRAKTSSVGTDRQGRVREGGKVTGRGGQSSWWALGLTRALTEIQIDQRYQKGRGRLQEREKEYPYRETRTETHTRTRRTWDAHTDKKVAIWGQWLAPP